MTKMAIVMMNNKGFMMAEVVVVASIVLVAMAGLYASYNKIFAIYNQRINYYDIATLYELGNYRKSDQFDKDNAVDTYNGNKVYCVELIYVKNNNVSVSNPKQTFLDYLKYLSTSINFDELASEGVNKILLMERCIDQDNCKYAYLEVFDDED